MNGVLTGVGKIFARTVPSISHATRAARNCPTRRDRLYSDHTLNAWSTGIYRQKLYELRNSETHLLWWYILAEGSALYRAS